jgi:aerotaxis receptor
MNKKIGIIPLSTESKFSIDEMFFSKTDAQGRILSSNDVFVRISEYPKDKLIGASHNIIRHPEMPKTVFRLLWDTVKKEKPIVAYVKNMTQTGKHYWVLVAVFPLKDDFVSIRIKPSTPSLDIIKGLYPLMLEAEKEGGMDKADQLLLKSLKENGFNSYSSFMTQVLISEIESRDLEIYKINQNLTSEKNYNSNLSKISQATADCISDYIEIFKNLKSFTEVYVHFKTGSEKIIFDSSDLATLSLNMSFAVERLGSEAAGLRAIALNYQSSSLEIISQIKNREQKSDLKELIEECQFYMTIAKLQLDMLGFFVTESLKESTIERDVDELLNNLRDLSALAISYLGKVGIILMKMNQVFNELLSSMQVLEKILKKMEAFKQVALVESTRTYEIETEFTPHLGETTRLISSMDQSVNLVKKSTLEFNENTVKLERKLKKINERMLAINKI